MSTKTDSRALEDELRVLLAPGKVVSRTTERCTILNGLVAELLQLDDEKGAQEAAWRLVQLAVENAQVDKESAADEKAKNPLVAARYLLALGALPTKGERVFDVAAKGYRPVEDVIADVAARPAQLDFQGTAKHRQALAASTCSTWRSYTAWALSGPGTKDAASALAAALRALLDDASTPDRVHVAGEVDRQAEDLAGPAEVEEPGPHIDASQSKPLGDVTGAATPAVDTLVAGAATAFATATSADLAPVEVGPALADGDPATIEPGGGQAPVSGPARDTGSCEAIPADEAQGSMDGDGGPTDGVVPREPTSDGGSPAAAPRAETAPAVGDQTLGGAGARQRSRRRTLHAATAAGGLVIVVLATLIGLSLLVASLLVPTTRQSLGLDPEVPSTSEAGTKPSHEDPDYWEPSWGPERPTYTMNRPAIHPAFNSITDNPVYGDERTFVDLKMADDDREGGWDDDIWASPGDVVSVRIYVENSGADNFEDVWPGQIQDARLWLRLFDGGRKHSVGAILSAANADDVWDGATIHADENVIAEWVPGSLTLYSNFHPAPNGLKLDQDAALTDGTLLGAKEMDGFIKPGYGFDLYVYAEVRISHAK